MSDIVEIYGSRFLVHKSQTFDTNLDVLLAVTTCVVHRGRKTISVEVSYGTLLSYHV